MNKQLNDFKIIKELGGQNKRKFNSVFLVQHKVSKEFAVLKHLIKTNKNIDTVQKIRFEANLKFDNVNMPKTILFHESEQEIFLIKTFFEGIELDKFWGKLKSKQKIDFLKIFFLKVEPLFNELKQKKLVHSDIKPSNIIIKGNELEFDVFIIDFGLSFYPENIERKVVFALGFSAPELILNKLHLANHATDIFSLGICIWKLIENHLPLTHPNPGIMTNLQLTHPLPETNKLGKEWNNILQKMCYKTTFKKAPNQLTNEEIEQLLINGINQRFQSISEINQTILKFTPKISFFQKLVKIFSKT